MFASIMRPEILDIFEQQHGRLSPVNDFREVKEQGSLSSVLETVGSAETVFLGNARNRKRLAGKPGRQQIVVGDG